MTRNGVVKVRHLWEQHSHTTWAANHASMEAAGRRVGMDYPTDLSQFDRFFPDEQARAATWRTCDDLGL